MVFIGNSIFHFSLSCLEKKYDLRLKFAKHNIHKSMISAQYFPLKAVFYRFYDVIYRHRESVFVLHRFIKPQLLNLQNFQPGELLASCLGFDLNLIFSRSRWSIKIQRGNQSIMLATCCYLTPKKMLIYNELVWYFLHL